MRYRFAIVVPKYILILTCCALIFFAPGIVQRSGATEPVRSKLVEDISSWDPISLRADILGLPLGPEHDFYAGQLANMEGDTALSSRLLVHALPSLQRGNKKLAA